MDITFNDQWKEGEVTQCYCLLIYLSCSYASPFGQGLVFGSSTRVSNNPISINGISQYFKIFPWIKLFSMGCHIHLILSMDKIIPILELSSYRVASENPPVLSWHSQFWSQFSLSSRLWYQIIFFFSVQRRRVVYYLIRTLY